MKTTVKNVVTASLVVALGMVFCGVVSADAVLTKTQNKTIGDFTDQGDGIDSTVNCVMNPSAGAGQVGNDSIVPPEVLRTLARSDGSEGGVLSNGFAESLATNYSPSSTTIPNEGGDYRPPEVVDTSGGSDDGGGGPATTPEPATLLIMGLGMAALLPAARRYRRK